MQSSRISRDDLISFVPQFVVREDASVVRLMRASAAHLTAYVQTTHQKAEAAWLSGRLVLYRLRASIARQATLATATIRGFAMTMIAAIPRVPVLNLPDWSLSGPKGAVVPYSKWRHLSAIWHPDRLPATRGVLGTAATLAFVLCGAFALLSGEPSQAVQPSPIAAFQEKPAEPARPKTPDWFEIRRPVLQFALDAPQSDRTAFRQKLLRSSNGAREEILTWGTLSASAFHAQIVVHHAGDPLPEEALFVAMARRAAASGIALMRVATPLALPTKFGDLETADAQMLGDETPRACLIFRQQRADSSFALAGWYCGSAEKPAERVALSCFVDRLDLTAAGDDVQLQQIFAAAERQRGRCPSGRADSRRLSWLDMDSRPPGLKSEMGPPMPSAKALARRHRHKK